MAEVAEILTRLEDRLTRIEARLESVGEPKLDKGWYTTKEVAEILGKSNYTVREWCRLQRVNAEKAMSGRGIDQEWRISHKELDRIRNFGLLAVKRHF